MNIWHDIPSKWIKPDNFTACIEISKGSKIKYELDKEVGILRMDRILSTATHYPHSYGFIPRTLAEDDDPLDVLVLCSEPVLPMSLIQCYPIGFINMVDSGKNDEKVIAIPLSDPVYNSYQSIRELPQHLFSEMEHFFTVYKQLEGRETSVISVLDKKEALQAIYSAIARYQRQFGSPRIIPL